MLRKNFVYILRLLAGKSERICTEFPLATFSAKILTTHPLKFPAMNFLNSISCKNNVESTPIIASFLVKIIFVLRNSESTKSISSSEFFVHNSLHEMHTKNFLTKKHHDKLKIAPKLDQLLIVFLAFVLNSD